MSASVLEQLRGAHEEIETIEKAIAKILNDKKTNPKIAVNCDRSIKDLLTTSQQTCKTVVEFYADKDGMRRDEIAFLAGQKATGNKQTDVWINFYDQMKQIKDYHRKTGTSGNAVELRDVDYYYNLAVASDDTEVVFSGEEAGGTRLDMHHFYQQYCNLKKIKEHRVKLARNASLARAKKRAPDATPEELEDLVEEFQEVDYITWLQNFDQFHDIPRFCKYRDEAYSNYLAELTKYLLGFIERAQPLVEIEKVEKQFEEEFADRFKEGTIPGWMSATHKENLYVRPTNRLFANEAVRKGHMGSKAYKKALQKMQTSSVEEQRAHTQASEEEDAKIAKAECKVQKLRDLLGDHVAETVGHLQKKQSRTYEEMEQEREKEAAGEEEDDEAYVEEDSDAEAEEEKERPIYNPLNLPLGWDGKPIPFWLYKLHGLGKEFKCEICGNYSYWGRRAFERHFSEWRHAFGMKCLKIPNTSHFKEVTKIEDAVVLYEKLKKQADDQTFRPDQDIECEDAHGNVMSLRAFEDLQRQGLA